jgi:aspartyl protease family protein
MIGKLAIPGVIAAGAAIGLLWPTAPRSNAAVTPSDVVLSRDSDKHFYADTKVNGHNVRFMIDTGAEQIALTEADAVSAGLQPDPQNYEVLGDGASGMVRGQHVQLKSLELNGMRRENVEAVIIQGATASLLGQSFLEQVDEIVIRKGEMRLRFTAA